MTFNEKSVYLNNEYNNYIQRCFFSLFFTLHEEEEKIIKILPLLIYVQMFPYLVLKFHQLNKCS